MNTMRTLQSWALLVLSATCLSAAPLRVVLLDTEDLTGQAPGAIAAGDLSGAALARKGAPLIAKQLVRSAAFALIDRRDFTTRLGEAGGSPLEKTVYMNAARALNADAVLRSALLSFSSQQRIIDQGGHHVEFNTLSLRAMVEVLDVTDGNIVAMADGVASREFRVTDTDKSILGEEDLLQLFEEAVRKAIPEIEQTIAQRQEGLAARAKVKLSVASSADPAMVEIDGVLVGTTPLENLEVYRGDHIITVGKPGHQDVTKRLLLEKDTAITVPMLRTDLTVEELTEVMKDMRMNRIGVMQPAWVIEDLVPRAIAPAEAPRAPKGE